ncbi:uncharacterized protein [Miscanthus floridulus]|uniref:uncharacterized protein n=1 Tax=Miscanthus floridulus TaxID=154761 RepID=UPI00345ADD74
MVFSDEEENREVIMTSAMHREPTATSASEEQEAAWCVEVPTSRKSVASVDAIGERAVKQMQSPRLLVVSLVPLSPVADMAEGARWFKEWTGTRNKERRVESACRESQVRVAEAATARVEGQRAAEQETAVEQRLEAARVRQEETEVGLRMFLANTEAALQEALAALEPEWATLESTQKALEAEQRAQSEVDREVLALQDQVMGMEDASAWLHEQPVSKLVALLAQLGEKVKVLERDLEMTKANFIQNVEELAKSHEERRALEGELGQIYNAA